MSYVYIESERFTDRGGVQHVTYTAGFYKPDGTFNSESDHDSKEKAADRVAWLNGGAPVDILDAVRAAVIPMYAGDNRAISAASEQGTCADCGYIHSRGLIGQVCLRCHRGMVE